MGLGATASESELPPFRPGDAPGTLLFRGLKHIANPPPWVLDVPGLRPPLPVRMPPGASLEHQYREAVKTRLEGRRPVPDMQMVAKAKEVVASGGGDAAVAVMYLREVGEEVVPSERGHRRAQRGPARGGGGGGRHGRRRPAHHRRAARAEGVHRGAGHAGRAAHEAGGGAAVQRR